MPDHATTVEQRLKNYHRAVVLVPEKDRGGKDVETMKAEIDVLYTDALAKMEGTPEEKAEAVYALPWTNQDTYRSLIRLRALIDVSRESYASGRFAEYRYP